MVEDDVELTLEWQLHIQGIFLNALYERVEELERHIRVLRPTGA